MKHATLTALIPTMLASPLLAHSGPHMHPHNGEMGAVGLAALLVIAAAVLAMKVRK